jgi:hypothetical protein
MVHGLNTNEDDIPIKLPYSHDMPIEFVGNPKYLPIVTIGKRQVLMVKRQGITGIFLSVGRATCPHPPYFIGVR